MTNRIVLTRMERIVLKQALRGVAQDADERHAIANGTVASLLQMAADKGLDLNNIKAAAAARQANVESLSPQAQEALKADLRTEEQLEHILGEDAVAASVSDDAAAVSSASGSATEDVTAAMAAKAGETPDEAFRRVQGLLGRGDFNAYARAIKTLAAEAAKPPREIVRQVEVEKVVTRDVVRREIVVAPPAESQAAKLGLPGIVEVSSLSKVWKGAQTLFPVGGELSRGIAVEVWDAPDAPAIDPAYVWPKSTPAIMSQLRRERNVMLVGPAGTGKTTLIEQIAARTGRPYVRIQCHRTTDAPDLIGMVVPTPGGVTWQDGQLAAAIRRPGTIIAVEEPSIARAGALFALQSVMDGARALYIAETGERVQVAPGVLFMLADNTGGIGDESGAYEGTQRLNRATLDRIGATVRIGYMPPDAEATTLVQRTGCTRELADIAVGYANATRDCAARGEVTHAVGLRRLMAWCELVTDDISPAEAFSLAIEENAPRDDLEKLRELFRATVQASAVLAAVKGERAPAGAQKPANPAEPF